MALDIVGRIAATKIYKRIVSDNRGIEQNSLDFFK